MMHPATHESKLKIIEQLIILDDDAVFNQIENLINKAFHRPAHTKLSQTELVNRAELSNKDIAEKNILSQSAAEKLSENW